MDEIKLREIIKEKINWKGCYEHGYDGFNMSGYDESHWRNLELISRFKAYMIPLGCDDHRKIDFIIPTFWKGSGNLLKINAGDGLTEIVGKEVGSINAMATEDILFKIITYQNPSILK